ncbi:peptidase associated/transthyretin-like domain-containing protein [Chryseobacterium defluvii]|uniref:Carboxypeptidase family protein n=1 Tax=Chryseobacterium defluvii TaxID=160396 RepID=A0A495SMU5_9FLAO|nr:carboxypeptidase-like regulatory domain-containing protein [Chryseobacterium defluvii]RKT01543.1 carboxypeptidase family protein [Chryseobacterium defluvii]
MKQLNFFLIAVMMFLFIGCNSNDTNEVNEITTPTVQMGKVSGKVVSKNGAKQIGGALIFTFDENSKMYYAYSDANGEFTLEAPEGSHTVSIQTGNGSNFRTEVNVNIKKNETTVLDNAVTQLNQVANMAYVKGTYDDIESIVTGLGYTLTQITYNDLKVMSTVAQYDVIFLNCGSKPGVGADDQAVYNNLSTFVSNGGSLYASDWAVAYLTGGGSNSNACNMAGGFIPDTKLCSVNNGTSGTINNTTISDVNLANALGFNTLNIHFDLGSWQKINMYDTTFWDVMVKNNNEALMIKTNKYHDASATQVPIGNSATNGWVTICHNPTGSNPMTITIPQSSWATHQAHGDTMGACNGSNNSGNIFYTAFHNHASGNIGNSGLILQYIILNL